MKGTPDISRQKFMRSRKMCLVIQILNPFDHYGYHSKTREQGMKNQIRPHIRRLLKDNDVSSLVFIDLRQQTASSSRMFCDKSIFACCNIKTLHVVDTSLSFQSLFSETIRQFKAILPTTNEKIELYLVCRHRQWIRNNEIASSKKS